MATRRPNEGAPSIRRLAAICIISFGALALTVVADLVVTATALPSATSSALRDARGIEIVNDIERSLLEDQRIGYLYMLTHEEKLAMSRLRVAVRIRDLLKRAEAFTSGPEERSLLQRVGAQVTTYLSRRTALERRGIDLPEVARLIQPTLRETTHRLASLRELNERQLQQAHAEALRMSRLSTLAGGSAGVLIVVGLTAVLFGVHGYVVRPMLVLHEAVDRFRIGDRDLRTAESGTREAAELARAFNEMADALARQRESQLSFLAGVAHDLRNPLAALKTCIHALPAAAADPEQCRVLAMLDRQVDGLARMVEDLLDAIRIEAGHLEVQIREFDLLDVAREVVRLYAPTAPNHEIVVDATAEAVPIRADPLRIEQVLGNLLNNAIKFSPDGGRIRIAAELAGDEVVLSVHDTGVGIPADELAHIFVPFLRWRVEVAPGAGLGLSVVRRIVTAHGGSVEVQSTPGEGSTFRVRLPRAPASPVAGVQPECPHDAPERTHEHTDEMLARRPANDRRRPRGSPTSRSGSS